MRWVSNAVTSFFLCILGASVIATPSSAPAAADLSFKDKTVIMLIGSQPGGGTDASGRAIARFMGKYLPGTPSVAVQNMPGASGVTAMNHFTNRTAPDGLTVIMGSNSTIDPVVYRNANAQYDTRTIRVIGGIGRGGTLLFVSKAAEPRLFNKSAEPAIIGSIGAVPRPGMQPALWSIEYLGWNAKWVVGYPGSSEVMVAFDRGEIDITSTSNIFLIQDRLKNGSLKILYQSGAVEGGKVTGRPEFGDAPLFSELMAGKVQDKAAQQAFDYWAALSSVDKWLGLPPGTPDDILAAYRESFRLFSADKDFQDLGEKISDGFGSIAASDVEAIIRTLADTPPEALQFLTSLMRKQGLRVK